MKSLYLSSVLALLLNCENKNPQKATISENIFYEKGFEFLEKKIEDSSFINFEKARNLFLQTNDSLRVAKCYGQMAMILCNAGDYFGSEEESVNALKFLNKNRKDDREVLISNYNNLGIISLNIKNYKASIVFFDKAQKFSNDSITKNFALSNEAFAYQSLKNYKKAIEIYENILSKISENNIRERATIQTNLAFTKFLQNPKYNAESELNNALQIRENINDLWGQNASHAHLSDYFEKKDKGKSLFHAYKMHEVASRLKSPDDQLEALQKLILLENPEKSRKYFLNYQKLSDSLQTARAKAKNQFALIRYETEQSKAKLLKSQAENAQKENEILRHKIIAGALFSSLIIGVFWYRKRKKRLEQEKQLGIKNTQLRISKKVHDEVANGIYRIISLLEYRKDVNSLELLEELDNVYEKSRNISYEDLSEKWITHEEIFSLLSSYSSDKTQVFIIGNDTIQWENINGKVLKEQELVLKELMTNMRKHSRASIATIKFEEEDGNLKISYTDNGIGLPKQNFSKKNGLTNVENRISALGGSVIFDHQFDKGTKITLNIPI